MTKVVEASGDGVRLRLRVQPKAARTEVAGLMGDALRIRLNAPPADGEANDCLIRFLAETLRVPRSSVTLKSGARSRSKLVEVSGITPAVAAARLRLPLPAPGTLP